MKTTLVKASFQKSQTTSSTCDFETHDNNHRRLNLNPEHPRVYRRVCRLPIDVFLSTALQDTVGHGIPAPHTLLILYDVSPTLARRPPEKRVWDPETKTGIRLMLMTLSRDHAQDPPLVAGFVQLTPGRPLTAADMLRTAKMASCVQKVVQTTVSWQALSPHTFPTQENKKTDPVPI